MSGSSPSAIRPVRSCWRFSGEDGIEYLPTEAALALGDVIMGLGFWARRWAHRALRDDEIDPSLLLWDMQRRLDAERTPRELVVVRFDFADDKRGFRHYWLKIDKGRGEVCIQHPGIEETLVVQSSSRTFTEIWVGHLDFDSAIRERRVTVDGPKEHVRGFPTWFRLHVFVELERGQEHASHA